MRRCDPELIGIERSRSMVSDLPVQQRGEGFHPAVVVVGCLRLRLSLRCVTGRQHERCGKPRFHQHRTARQPPLPFLCHALKMCEDQRRFLLLCQEPCHARDGQKFSERIRLPRAHRQSAGEEGEDIAVDIGGKAETMPDARRYSHDGYRFETSNLLIEDRIPGAAGYQQDLKVAFMPVQTDFPVMKRATRRNRFAVHPKT